MENLASLSRELGNPADRNTHAWAERILNVTITARMPDDILVSFIEDQDETLAKLLENFGLLTGGCLKNESCTTEEDNKITTGTAQTVATDGINRKAWPPQNDNRTRLNRILWIARSGVQWRKLSEVYGPWQSMYT